MTDELARVQREERNGAVVVHVSGEIDLSNADELHGRIHRELRGAPLAVVSLAEIAYIDSQGLRLLKRLSDQLEGEGSKLEVVAPPESIARDVLDMTRMSEDITIRDALAG
jgi:anti-sigma B factor antagonist